MKIKILILATCLFAIFASSLHAAWAWQAANGSTNVQVAPSGAISLTLAKPGEVMAAASGIPVTSGQRVFLTFNYTASGLAASQPLELSLHWFNAAGEDVDAARLPLGFPPRARVWQFSRNSSAPVQVSDNLTVPEGVSRADFTLRLVRGSEKGAITGITRVQASDFDLHEGEHPVAGIEMPDSGPADAGPLSQQPAGVTFGTNLVPNGDLEEGTDSPLGWKIEGDNVNGSAEWAQGGAFSGRHAFKLYDRGPYVNSWDHKPGDPVIAGGKPGGNAANAREEVSARWVSDPVSAQPGTAYQANAFYWYGNRTFLDRGIANPITIQFLDAHKKPLRQTTPWDDWFGDARVITRSGWVMAPSKPVIAPPGTAFLRAEVRMPHAMVYQSVNSAPVELLGEHRMILVDNISVYALPNGNTAQTLPDQAFASAAASRALPFVPSSPQHRPNSILAASKTDEPGGLIIRPYDKQGADKIQFELTNLLGDIRQTRIAYDVIDLNGKTVQSGRDSGSLSSFGQASVAFDLPSSLPYGPYLIRYQIGESGSDSSIQGETCFGIMPPRVTTLAERSRMDYPFSLWMPFPFLQQPERTAILGRLAENAGVGKTWFGTGTIYLDQFVRIKDPAARKAAIDKQVADSRAIIAFWKKYHILPMGHMEPPQLLDPSLYPVMTEVVKAFVAALKGDIHFWRYGTESIHGGIHELDRATVDNVNVAGGHDYLGWGMKGTVRQYWATYLLAFKAAKEIDPHCFFGPNSASDIEGSVLHTFFQVMPPTDLDGFGMNTYISAYSIWPPNEHELQLHGIPNLPIFVSEFGVAGASPTAPDHLEKEHATSQHEVTYWSSVLQSFPNLFHLEQDTLALRNDEGSMTYEGHVRPFYLAYANMTNLYGAGKFIAKYDPPGLEIYVRQRSVQGGYVAMIDATGEDRAIDLDAGEHPALVDLWGNRSQPPLSSGVLTVQASHDPLYIVSDQEIRPHMGVSITVDPATLDPSHPRVSVSLQNQTKEPAPGRLELIQSGPLQISNRVRDVPALAPGQKVSLFFDVHLIGDMPATRLPIRVRYTVGSKTYELPAGVNFNTARKAKSPVTINADSSGWNAAEFNMIADQASQFSGNGSPKPWGGPGDISARTAFRWDNRFLYVFFKVTDDIDMPPQEAGHPFASDSIELFLDLSRKLASDAPFTMFSLAKYPDGPHLLRFDGSLPKGAVPGSKIAARRIGTLSLYEAAIPWTEISPGFTPHAGQILSLAWYIDDFDGGDTGMRKIAWFSSEKNPAKFGDLILTNN